MLEARGPVAEPPSNAGPRRMPGVRRRAALVVGTTAIALVVFIAAHLPGPGGAMNIGDSAKFQILALAPILVHPPGYPLYELLASGLRALDLSAPAWWQTTVFLSAVPGAVAVGVAAAIGARLTGRVGVGAAAAAVLLGARLMLVQATETEVYALNLMLTLLVVWALLRFQQDRRTASWLLACGVYALSFGHHLMIAMLLPVFAAFAWVHRDVVLRRWAVLAVLGLIALGASQYAYLYAFAQRPDLFDYGPFAGPPTLNAFLPYMLGLEFRDLMGVGGLAPGERVDALWLTLRDSIPVMGPLLAIAGLFATVYGVIRDRREAGWRGVALIWVAGLSFVPFYLGYGAYDIRAFHLPGLALVLVGATAALGLASRARPRAQAALALVLILAGGGHAAWQAAQLAGRTPAAPGFASEMRRLLQRVPGEAPIVITSYDNLMLAQYHAAAGHLPKADYRLHWNHSGNLAARERIHILGLNKWAERFRDWLARPAQGFTCRGDDLDLTSPLSSAPKHYVCRKASGES